MTGQAISPHRAIPWLLVAMAAMLLAGCVAPGKPKTSGQFVPGAYKVGNSYQVGGQWYYPKVDLAYDERGVASWYGPNFDGKKTANGEIYDMTLVSAAHKTLPLPSVVRFTNLQNGRSLVIRINDRGPFVRGRIIDLSRRAAELLGFSTQGTAMVQVRLLPEESRQAALAAGASAQDLASFGPPAPQASPSVAVSVEILAPAEGVAASMPPEPTNATTIPPTYQASTPPPYGGMAAIGGYGRNAAPAVALVKKAAAAPVKRPAPINVATLPSREEVEQLPVSGSPNIFIQAGAFREYVNANRLRVRLTKLGHPVNVSQVYVTNQPFFRVRLGPLGNVENADRALRRVVELGYPDAQIVID